MKLEVETLSTVPDAPPAAGPDRALDPAPPDARPPAAPLPAAEAEGDEVAVEDVPQAESPITALMSAPPMVHRLLPLDSNRRTLGRRRWLAMITEADESGEDAGGGGGAAPAPPELPATSGTGVALETGRTGTVSWVVVGS